MRAAVLVGRYWVIFLMNVSVQLGTPVVGPLASWSRYWVANRSSIMLFSAVNTSITIASEAGVRMAWPLLSHEPDHGFIVRNEQGNFRVHQQSLINIFMTFFASLIGGPVYFIRSKFSRFLFFVGFGTFNSLLSQGLVTIFRDGIISFAATRLWFDFCYNGTIKFLMFELARPRILRKRHCVRSVTMIRSTQDFLTTCFRVAILNLLGLKS